MKPFFIVLFDLSLRDTKKMSTVTDINLNDS